MKKDKISTCLKNWNDIQEGRLSELKMHRVRVEHNGSHYGRLYVTKFAIIVIPDDVNRLGISLDDLRLIGVNEPSTKTITLNLIGGETIKIIKSVNEQKRVLRKIRDLIG